MSLSSSASDFFIDNGYVVVDLPNHSIIDSLILDFIKTVNVASLKDLESYHNFVADEELHVSIQSKLLNFCMQNRVYDRIVEENIDIFKEIVGSDLLIQNIPHFRISRPSNVNDNIGYHRDTWYGATSYEVSVVVPFTNMGNGSGLRIMPKSHTLSESDIAFIQVDSTSVSKGDSKHFLGYPYSPRTLDESLEKDLIEVNIKPGQVLMFSLSTVHGQKLNSSKNTRFSTDFRLVNAASPIDFFRETRGVPYYRNFCNSPSMMVGNRYSDNQK